MPLYYAGVPLPFPSAEVRAAVEARMSIRDVADFRRPLVRAGRDVAYLSLAAYEPERPIRLNTLWWPTGAARWAYVHLLATGRQVVAMRYYAMGVGSVTWTPYQSGSIALSGSGATLVPPTYPQPVFTAGTPQSQPLVMDDTNGGVVFTNMWMLPARPLFQIPSLPAPLDQLYLVTLVDDRFFWWERSADCKVTQDTTQWLDLFNEVVQGIGITVIYDPINAAYSAPARTLASHYESLPALLDALAWNVGQRIVRRLDGTVEMIGPRSALTRQQVIAQAGYPLVGGGLQAFGSPGNELGAPAPPPAGPGPPPAGQFDFTQPAQSGELWWLW